MRLMKYLMLMTSMLLVACGDDKGSSSQEKQVTKQYDCTITYGWEPRKPYQFFENKQMQGIDVDILRAAAEKSNCQLTFVEKDWNDLLNDVKAGKVDVLGGATPTEERKEYADFSAAYRAESFILFIPTNSDFSGNSLSDFLSRGNKIGVSAGYFYGDDVADLMASGQYADSFVSSPTNEASFFSVEYGRVNGVLVDPIEGRYIIKRKGMGSKMKESEISIPAESVAYMFSKKSKSADKIAQIKSNLEQMISNNQVQQFIGNYQ